mmetsp:Transcript_96631/g.259813  ORF Transcript_96631/g.259813 Transcript_96631/m.259813 type:complete len:266 (+) Transcript_96631:2-799(+)
MDALASGISLPDDSKKTWFIVNMARTFGEDIPQAFQQTLFLIYVKQNYFMIASVAVSVASSVKALHDAVNRGAIAVGAKVMKAFTIGDCVRMSEDPQEVRDSFNEIAYSWDDVMADMCGKEYKVLKVAGNIVGLPSPDGSQGGVWYFSAFVLAKAETRNNDQGAPVARGSDRSCSQLFYCGRNLGTAAIPGSDGRCGPSNGPQCSSCKRYQAKSNVNDEGSPAQFTQAPADSLSESVCEENSEDYRRERDPSRAAQPRRAPSVDA